MDTENKLHLKVQALLEKVSSLTANYENQIADLRVECTVMGQELQAAHQALADMQNEGTDEVPAEADSTADTSE